MGRRGIHATPARDALQDASENAKKQATPAQAAAAQVESDVLEALSRPNPHATRFSARARIWLALCTLTSLAGVLFFGYIWPLGPGRMARASAALIPELPHWAFASGFSGQCPS